MNSLAQTLDLDSAIAALDGYLRERDYNRENRYRIAIRVRTHGELSGTVPEYLDREDLETATEVLVDGFAPVVHASPEWGDLDTWEPGPAVPADAVFDFPDAPDHVVTQAPGYWEALEDAGITRLPAVSGGSPAAAPYEPTAEDWADYREWSSSLAVKRWLAENPNFEAWLAANGGPAE